MSDTWSPPPAPLACEQPQNVRGTLYGSRLYEQPAHRPVAEAIQAFVSSDTPVGFEIGFDHGMCILDRARNIPSWRWLGAEIREARVLAAAPHAPPNCLLVRADARALLASVLPEASLSAVYLLFPTPTDNPRHLLLTPAFVSVLARCLKPGGILWFATDVEGMAQLAEQLFQGWPDAEPPPLGTELSRRERVCKRDNLQVWRLCRARP